MKRILIFFSVLLGCFVFFAMTVIGAVTEFSADLSMTIANGKAMTGKVFVQGDKIRNEVSVMGQSSITIARQDKRITWLLMPAVQKYREMPMKYDPAHPTADMPFETKEIGKGNANGYDCKLVQYKFKNREYGIVVNWVASKLKMPVRVQVKNKSGALVTTIDYTNIKIGPQSALLFEIPAGYAKMESPQ